MLIQAVLLYGLAFVVALVAVVLFGVVYRGLSHSPWAGATDPAFLRILGNAALIASEIALALIAWFAAIRLGDDTPASLGLARIRHPLTLIAAIPVTIIASAACAWVLQSYGSVRVSQMTSDPQSFTSDPALGFAFALVSEAVLPAVAEEMFFRGWLWGALFRSWHPLPVALATSSLFLAAHFDGSFLPLFLVPMTIGLSYLRHRCGSLWASMALHFANNAFATASIHLMH